MQPDVLFWFYKEFTFCRKRLIHLRKKNPEVKIYALYGGPLSKSSLARSQIEELVDDFYAYPGPQAPEWKWQYGDHLIASWHRERGRHLPWETIFVMQWDMLVLDRLDQIFVDLKPGQILLSGFDRFDAVSDWWPWAKQVETVGEFRQLLQEDFNFHEELFVCLFIVACLPREFLNRYVATGPPVRGFLEYRVPTMAKLFGIPFCNSESFQPWWAANPATPQPPSDRWCLNAVGKNIPLAVILAELGLTNGRRIFHPYEKAFPPWLESFGKSKLSSWLFKAAGISHKQKTS